MYLAIKEIKHSKLRYSLIIFTIFLIAYLIYFLTGLAYGLANNNRSAVDHWQAEKIVLSQYANENLAASNIDISQRPDIKGNSKDQADLGEMMGVVSRNGKAKENVSVFGINFQGFLKPNLIKGHYPKKANEVVVDESLSAVRLNQKLKINGQKAHFKVVGLTSDHRYNTQPVVYSKLKDFQYLRSGNSNNSQINAIVLRNGAKLSKSSDQLKVLTIPQLINKIPGYGPQVKTFALMIGALFIIVAFIVGIFMYIITIEKTAVYGVMRAQGISGRQLVGSLIWQSLILGALGIALGLIANWLTTIVLPESVPYTNNGLLIAGFSLVLLVMTLLGALFSIWRILKIDPLDAIGGA